MLRGIAVLLMIVYHALFDLEYFFDIAVPGGLDAWTMLSRITATLFLLTVGIVSAISWEHTPSERRWPKSLRRAALLLAAGMAVSLATRIAIPHAPVYFGILHLIGLSALLQPMFHPLGAWNALAGIVALSIPTTAGSWSTLPFGFPPSGLASVDYYPLLPWFGIVLIGMAAGHALYVPSRHWLLHICTYIQYPHWLLWCGRHALFLYFVHQPVLLGMLTLVRAVWRAR